MWCEGVSVADGGTRSPLTKRRRDAEEVGCLSVLPLSLDCNCVLAPWDAPTEEAQHAWLFLLSK